MIQYLLEYYHCYANKSVSSNCQQLFPNFTIYNKTSNKEIPVDTFNTTIYHHYQPSLNIYLIYLYIL